eukprot:4790834-Pleurochrysis_carterae.AAC.1
MLNFRGRAIDAELPRSRGCILRHWHLCVIARFLRDVELIPRNAWRHLDLDGFLPLSSDTVYLYASEVAGLVVIKKFPFHTLLHSQYARP